ncbi:MAG: hypothetical protein AB1449_15035 [Chloroflexota bacterium]
MTERRKRRGPLPIHHWPLLKVLALEIPVSALWCALPLAIPPYLSKWAIAACAALFLAILISTLVVYYNDSLWARATAGFCLLGGPITLIAARAWLVVLSARWEWLLPLVGGLVVAVVLPFIAPKLSRFLWIEQNAPRTRIGRAFMALCLALAPAAGTLGAAAGMYGSRFLGDEPTFLAIAVLSSATGIGFAFAISYQFVEWRPRRKQAARQAG